MRDCAGPYQRAGVFVLQYLLPFVLKAEIKCNTHQQRNHNIQQVDRDGRHRSAAGRQWRPRKQPIGAAAKPAPLACRKQHGKLGQAGKKPVSHPVFYTGGREPPFGNCSYLPRVLALALSGCTRPSGLGSGLANCAIFLDPWHESVIHAALCQTFLHPPPFPIRKLPIATWSPMGSCIATLSKRLRWKSCSRSGTRS